MFQISHTPIQPQVCQADMAHSAAGGYVSFEGWVRDHNEGKTVVALAYEAYESLAQKEGLLILEEAKHQFEIIDAHCVHRVGALGIGDLAVWVGVTSAHRQAAFEACEYVINQVKHRLPIWKKETYADGDSGWINCQQCAGAVHTPKTEPALCEQDFYARQIQLPEMGASGQAKLKASKVLVVGAGGLGSSALQCLAAAGIGTLGICDFDQIEISNLHRQMLYRIADLGSSKAEAAARHLRQLNPFIQINAQVLQLTENNAASLMQPYDWVLDCTDNFEAKYALNDAAVLANKPLIQASIYQYEGQMSFYQPNDREAPCLRCLWPEPPLPGDFSTCSVAGVLGATASYFGTLQAMQLIQQVLVLPGRLQSNELLTVDMLNHTMHRFKRIRNAHCVLCGEAEHVPFQSTLSKDEYVIDRDQLSSELLKDLILVDLCEDMERSPASLVLGSWHIPYSQFLAQPPVLNPDKKYLLFCPAGGRSLYLTKMMRRQGALQVYSLSGGLSSLESYYCEVGVV